ncbi:arylalkylamine N-acetyltransferase 1-like [Schistocerca nitens]|uniref:arylalkylamine N-acetyltransferase 1-like n=1 Tax=Schistocerca nitens TaxID=7011 RepID=UPI0021199D15|nr:arylalkylamine N-acetyltransferase 1-like [Schistocerca nitens]
MSSPGFDIRTLTERDGPQLVSFLRRFFLRDEPLNAAVGIMADGQDSSPEQEGFCLEALPEGLSLQAVDTESGNLLGVSLSRLHQPGLEAEAVKSAEACPDPTFRKILRLIAFVDLQVSEKLRSLFPEADLRQVEVQVVSVDTATRGRGVAKALIDHTRKLAKDRGIPLVRIDCSSVFSARAAERLGFQKVFSLKYDSYRPDGEVVFTPSEQAGDEYCTYIQRVI